MFSAAGNKIEATNAASIAIPLVAAWVTACDGRARKSARLLLPVARTIARTLTALT